MAARVLLALVAVLVIAWAGVLLRDHQTGEGAVARSLFIDDVTPEQRARDRKSLEDAQLLDPSSNWALGHAINQIRSGDFEAAAREAEQLVRDEPENTAAWQALRVATREIDPRRSAQAQARLRKLDPFGSG